MSSNSDAQTVGAAPDRAGSVGSKSSATVLTSPKTPSKEPRLPLGGSADPTRYPLTISSIGKHGGSITLFANSQADRRAWIEAIEERRRVVNERKRRFDVYIFAYNPVGTVKVNCSSAARSTVFLGCDTGVYVGDPLGSHYEQVLELEKVTQMDVLHKYGLVILLADRTLYTFPLESLNPGEDPSANTKKGRRISSHVSFFKVGSCNGRTLICAVKSTALSSTVKTFEPVAPSDTSTKKSGFLRMFKGSPESVKVFKEFYIPSESTSIHFLKTKLCVGCAKGFEIVDLESLNTQGLLDPTDESLEFVMKRENLRPVAIFRLPDGSFMLCYDGGLTFPAPYTDGLIRTRLFQMGYSY